MKIFKTECLLNTQLPNTHACSSATQEFCPNPLLLVVMSEKTYNKLIFSCFQVSGLISLQQSLLESNELNFMMK